MRDHLPNTVPLKWKVAQGDHNNFIEWIHGPLYSDQCAVCQQGVQMIMQAIQWLDGGVLVERDTIQSQDSRGLVQEIYPGVTRTWDPNSEKVIIVDFEPTPESVLSWFIERFQHQFQMAHVNTVYLTDKDEIIFEKLLDF